MLVHCVGSADQEKLATYPSSTGQINHCSGNVPLFTGSLGGDLVKQGTEHVSFLTDRVHVAGNNCSVSVAVYYDEEGPAGAHLQPGLIPTTRI